MPTADLAYTTDAPRRSFIPNFRPTEAERFRRGYVPPARFVPALPAFDLQEIFGALAPAEVRALHFIASGEDLEPMLEDEGETDCEASRDYLDDSDGLPGDPDDADPDDLF